MGSAHRGPQNQVRRRTEVVRVQRPTRLRGARPRFEFDPLEARGISGSSAIIVSAVGDRMRGLRSLSRAMALLGSVPAMNHSQARRFHPMRKLNRCCARRPGGTRHWVAAEMLMQIIHHFKPDRRRAGDSADVAHRRAREIAGPHSDGEAVGVADAPVVAHVLAGPGLDRAPVARGEIVLQAEGGAAAGAIGEDIGDQVGGRGRVDAGGCGGWRDGIGCGVSSRWVGILMSGAKARQTLRSLTRRSTPASPAGRGYLALRPTISLNRER